MAATTSREGHVIVFDFDWSLINENSDYWIIKQLGPELVPQFKQLCSTLHFTDAMDEAMKLLFDKGIKREDFEKAFAKIPFFQEMQDGVKEMSKQGHSLYILSDANTFFISTILSSYGLSSHFKHVFSNKGEFDEKQRLGVSYFHTQAHGCDVCPKNLCKGKVLKEILASEGISLRERKGGRRVVYVGDGGNDVCPSRLLGSSDVVMARRGYRLSKRLGEKPPAARVELWGDGKEALGHIKTHVLAQAKPTSEISSVRTLQGMKNYTFLVCGQHPSLVQALRACLKKDSKEAAAVVSKLKEKVRAVLGKAGIRPNGAGSSQMERPLTIGVSLGYIARDVVTQTHYNEDVVMSLIMDPLDIDCKQLTFICNDSVSKLSATHINKLLYKLQFD